MKKVLLYLRVARAHTLFMTAGIILCYFFYAFRNQAVLNILPFCFVSISAFLFHLSVNTISEYRDCEKGIDDKDSPGPKYRLIRDPLPRKNILYFGYVAFSLAATFGIIVVFLSGIEILLAGVLGASLCLFYSEFWGYKYRALGDFGVFLGYGPLLCFSIIFSLSKSFSLNDFCFSVPFGLLTVSVLWVNNIRDYEFDKKKTKTSVTVLGLKWSYTMLFFMVHLAFFVVLLLIYQNILPKTCFLSFLSYPVLFLSLKRFGTPEFVDVFGILQVLFCFLTLTGLIIG